MAHKKAKKLKSKLGVSYPRKAGKVKKIRHRKNGNGGK